jgi:hypothetical protein
LEKLKALSTGTKLVLVAGPLLFLSLFFDWQTAHIDYGPAGVAKIPEDGWDVWGLLIGALTIATITLVVLRRLTEVEMAGDVPWDGIVLGLAATTFAVAVFKNLTDAYSTWASYGFVGLAGVVAVGAYLDWARERRAGKSPLLRRKEPGGQSKSLTSSTRSSPGPS